MKKNSSFGYCTTPDVSGAGTFTLRDVIHLATPPPHPSEAPITNINPLATTPAPPTAGVKLSLVTISPGRSASQLYKFNIPPSTRSPLVASSIKESDQESIPSNETSSDGNQSHVIGDSSTPAFGEGNLLLSVPIGGKDVSKRKKPKTNILKSNSSLISRVVPHEAYSKRVQDHSADGLLLFANVNRAFQWLDLSSPTPAKVWSPFTISIRALITVAGRPPDEDTVYQSAYAMS